MNLDYPFHFDVLGRTALTDEADHIEDMIEQFLFTDSGERVMLAEFGSGLRHHVLAPNSPEVAAAIQFSAQSGLQRWLGDVVEVRELVATSVDATLTVRITYSIRRTNETRTRVFERGVV